MPMDRSKYPDHWETISAHIRQRAGDLCEWCGAPNGVWIRRDKHNPFAFTITALGYEGPGCVKVVLTVHHIGIDKPDGTPGDRHDKHDCRDENLAALCQRCHLLADLDLHMANAAATRRRKRVESGQLELATT